MPRITYIEHDQTEHLIDVENGWSVMEGAVKNDVPGMGADCGGACACATCHVVVDPAWFANIGQETAIEESMLDFAEDVQVSSITVAFLI